MVLVAARQWSPPLALWVRIAGVGVAALALATPYLAFVVAPLAARAAPEVPLGVVLAAQLAQTAVLVAGAAAIGVSLHRKVGLEAPLFERWAGGERPRVAWGRAAAAAVVAGALAALAVLALAAALAPRLPEALVAATGEPPPWPLALLAVAYGGVVEEILVRWGVLTLLLWALLRLGLSRTPAFWSANVVAALAFGALHLPLALGVVGGLPPAVVAYVVVANGAAGVLFGWLYGRFGLESAMLAHGVADVGLHVVPSLLA